MRNISSYKIITRFMYSALTSKLECGNPRLLSLTRCQKPNAYVSTSSKILYPKKWKEDKVPEPPKPPQAPIAVHDQNDKFIGLYPRGKADKMARDLGFKLVCVKNEDDKIYYKFMTGQELNLERLKLREEKKDKDILKDEKLLTISSKITEHDLKTRTKAVNKWLIKKHKVQILIEGSPTSKPEMEKIVETIKNGITNLGKIIDTKNKPGRMLVLINPLAKDNDKIEE